MTAEIRNGVANTQAPGEPSAWSTVVRPLAWESDVQWLKYRHEQLGRRAARLRERGNHGLAETCEIDAARFLRIWNRLRLADLKTPMIAHTERHT